MIISPQKRMTLYSTIAFYDATGGKTFGTLIYSSTQSYDERDWVMKTDTQVLTIPAGKYLCGYHCGSYENDRGDGVADAAGGSGGTLCR